MLNLMKINTQKLDTIQKIEAFKKTEYIYTNFLNFIIFENIIFLQIKS